MDKGEIRAVGQGKNTRYVLLSKFEKQLILFIINIAAISLSYVFCTGLYMLYAWFF